MQTPSESKIMSDDSVKVIVRARPLIEKEIQAFRGILWTIHENTIQSSDRSVPIADERLHFDHIFDIDSTNKQIYDATISHYVLSCLEGYNCTILSYGQTSSGKIHTMEGTPEDPGIIPRTIEQIFKAAGKDRKAAKYLIRVAYFKIHEDKIYDLLKFSNEEVKIRRNEEGGIMICAKEVVTSTKDQIFDLLRIGTWNRQFYSQKLNIKESHSDTIFRIIIEHELKDGTDSVIPVAHLNLVTLAGSERIPRLGDLKKFTDREYVNNSLSVLSSIISQNVEKMVPVNYCESKLTVLLKNAIGGNAKTVIIANISLASLENTYFTLCFAEKVKNIRNKPTINIISTGNSFLRQCLSQIQQLDTQLRGVKEHCAELKAVAQTMQNIDIIHERINLVSKVFTKADVTGDAMEYEFRYLLSKSSRVNLSSLEMRLLNVLRANNLYNADFIGKRTKLPFEMLLSCLSSDIGNDYIIQLPEEDQEELLVIDYIIDTDVHRGESELEFSEKDADDVNILTPMDISFEYSELERSITSRITNEELRRDLTNLTALFAANYSQQVTINKDIEEQNQRLLTDIANLNQELSVKEQEKDILQQKMTEFELKLTSKDKPVTSDLKKKYEQLLMEVDQKDMEFFDLVKQKNVLEKRVQDLTATMEKTKKLASPLQPIQATDSNISILQSEVNTLNQKLVDQEFIISEMQNKHKRREDELLKRLQDKERSLGKIFSTFVKKEQQVQVSPSVEHSVSQTEKRLNLDISLHVEEYIPEPATSEVDISQAKILATVRSTKCIQTETDIEEISEIDLQDLNVIEETMFQFLSSPTVNDKDIQMITNILVSGKDAFTAYHKKYNVLHQLQTKDLSTYTATKEAVDTLKEILDSELEDSRAVIQKAHSWIHAISTILTELRNYRICKQYKDIPKQLVQQVSTFQERISELECQLETERATTLVAQNECTVANYEVGRLREMLHRILPSTVEKQILQEIAESKEQVMSLQRDNAELNKNLKEAKHKIDTLETRNKENASKIEILNMDIASKENIQETLLQEHVELEIEVIVAHTELIKKSIEINALSERLPRLSEAERVVEAEGDSLQASGETIPDNIYGENNFLKKELSRVENLLKEQMVKNSEHEKNVCTLENMLKEHVSVQKEVQKHLGTDVENVQIENIKKTYENEIRMLKTQIEQHKKDLQVTVHNLMETEEKFSTQNKTILMLQNKLKDCQYAMTADSKDVINLLQKYEEKETCIENLRKQLAVLEFEKQYFQSKLFDMEKIVCTTVDEGTKADIASKLYRTKSLPILQNDNILTNLTHFLRKAVSAPNLNILEVTGAINESLIEIFSLKNTNLQLAERTKTLNNFENILDALNAALNSVENKYSVIQNDIDNLLMKNTELENHLCIALNDLIDVVRSVEKFKLEVKPLFDIEQKLLAYYQTHAVTIENLKNEINKLEGKLELLTKSSRRGITTKAIEEKIIARNDYLALIDEYQNLLVTHAKVMKKQEDLEHEEELKLNQPEIAETDRSELTEKIERVQVTLNEKAKLEEDIQHQIVALQNLNEEVSKCCDSEPSSISGKPKDSISLQAAVQQLQCLKNELQQELHEHKEANTVLLEQCKVFKEESPSEDYTALKRNLTEEINSFQKKCLLITEQNRSLFEKVSELKLAYSHDIRKRAEQNPKLQEILQRKEKELVKIKSEVLEVYHKLSYTSKEFDKIKAKCLYEGAERPSTSTESHQTKKESTDTQCDTSCVNCNDLKKKIKDLETKLAALEVSDTFEESLEKYKSYIKSQNQELEDIHDSNEELSIKFTQLQNDYEELLKAASHDPGCDIG